MDKEQSDHAAAQSKLPYAGMMLLGAMCAVPGLVYGLAMACCGFGFLGSGHGGTPILLLVALPSFFFLGALGFAWGYFQSRLADLMIIPVLSYAIFSDWLLFVTFDEALYQRIPGAFQQYYMAWAGWQTILLALIVVRLSTWVRFAVRSMRGSGNLDANNEKA